MNIFFFYICRGTELRSKLNALIDDGGNAVICDFGLSRIKSDINSKFDSKSRNAGFGAVGGTLNWMAPGRLIGETADKPSDIYSLEMTAYEVSSHQRNNGHRLYIPCEIFANNTPFSDSLVIVNLVVTLKLRPQRPAPTEKWGLSDNLWGLNERCWVQDAWVRPRAPEVCESMEQIRSKYIKGNTVHSNYGSPPASHLSGHGTNASYMSAIYSTDRTSWKSQISEREPWACYQMPTCRRSSEQRTLKVDCRSASNSQTRRTRPRPEQPGAGGGAGRKVDGVRI